MLDGYWKVTDNDGKEFKIYVNNGIIPPESKFAGEFLCKINDTYLMVKSMMCCPNCVSISKNNSNTLIFKENDNPTEVWEKDTEMYEKLFTNKSKFVQLTMNK